MNDSRLQLSVLVVDDSTDMTSSTSELLTLVGCAVRVATSGSEALALVASDPPDVILLDLLMPQMDGYEVARRLSALKSLKPSLLVAVTGCGTEEDRARTAAAGFDLHLVKPVDPALLIGLLRRFRRALVQDPTEDTPPPGGDTLGGVFWRAEAFPW